MLYNYEAAVIKFVNNIVPNLKISTYAKEADVFKAMTKTLQYPSFFYFRESTEWEFNVKYRFTNEKGQKIIMCPFTQTYVGKIFVETILQSQEVAERIRLLWSEYPYVNLMVDDEPVKVALRLLYIKIDEDRTFQDEKGPRRYVEFKWSSRIFALDVSAVREALVENINLTVNDDKFKN